MNIKFYKSLSDNNVINKTITEITTKDCRLLDATSLTRPSLRVRIDNRIIGANYLYIPNFSRYYFINEITFDGADMIISANVDVLMSVKDELLALPAIIARSEKAYNLSLPDDSIPQSAKREQQVISFTGGESVDASKLSTETPCYVISVIGGVE